MPRFSANLGFLWPDRPFLDRMRAAADAGFRAVEAHWPYDTPAGEVKALAAERGLTLLGVNTVVGSRPGDFGTGAQIGREAEFQAAVDQSVAFCRGTGFSAIHCMAGVVAEADRAAARELFARNLRQAADKAAPHGITILLEPINPRDKADYFYSTVAAAAEMQDLVGRPNVKLMFDCYHAGVAEGDILKKLEKYLPRIGHIQFAAVPSRAEPDEGEIAYDRVFRAIDALGYEGWVGAEYKPRAGTDEGLGWVKALGVAL